MKTYRILAFCFIGVGMLAYRALGMPVDLSAPSGELGAANSKGYLEIWREIDNVGLQLGKGSFLPLRYKFSTDPTIGGILGPGFYMPMFEAKNVLIRENTMRAYLPCGKGLYLWRDTVDPTKFHTPDNVWTGALNSNGDFTLWRDDGWCVFYHQGRLTSIATDEHHVFNWNYDSNTHLATAISEDGRSLITVEPNTQGLVSAVVSDGKRYELGYAKRPLVELLQGQSVVKQLAIALSSFKYPDGKTETFHFELTSEGVPTVTFSDPDQKQTFYSWYTATGHIATEKGPAGNWSYNIGGITQDFGLPPITRISSDGRSEGITVDNKMGTYTSTQAGGVTTITHVFETPGPLYHKVQNIEEIHDSAMTLVYHASYDESGRLIREQDENGFITTYNYDKRGNINNRIVKLTKDANFMQALNSEENILIKAVQQYSSFTQRNRNLEKLAIFYIKKEGDISKATDLVPQIKDSDIAFNVMFNVICSDCSISGTQKVAKLKAMASQYPTKKAFLDTFNN